MGPKFGLQSERLVCAVRGYKETQKVGTLSEWAKVGAGVETETPGLGSPLRASGLCRLPFQSLVPGARGDKHTSNSGHSVFSPELQDL